MQNVLFKKCVCTKTEFLDSFLFLGGIDTESSYPYRAEDEKCHYNPKNKGATDKGFVDIESGDEDHLKAAVATVGPVSVAIDASHESFQLYADGKSFIFFNISEIVPNACALFTFFNHRRIYFLIRIYNFSKKYFLKTTICIAFSLNEFHWRISNNCQ